MERQFSDVEKVLQPSLGGPSHNRGPYLEVPLRSAASAPYTTQMENMPSGSRTQPLDGPHSLTPSNLSRSYSESRPSTRLSIPASSRSRPSTSHGRPKRAVRRAASSIGTRDSSEEIVCALSEGRGVSPSVGVTIVNITTGEVVLSQICDNQFYVKTLHKIQVNQPTWILILATTCPPNPHSTLFSLIQEHIDGANIVSLERKFWSESRGLEYIEELAFREDAQAIKVAIEGNFYATCSLSAVSSFFHGSG